MVVGPFLLWIHMNVLDLSCSRKNEKNSTKADIHQNEITGRWKNWRTVVLAGDGSHCGKNSNGMTLYLETIRI